MAGRVHNPQGALQIWRRGAPALEMWRHGIKMWERSETEWLPGRINRARSDGHGHTWSTTSANPLTDAEVLGTGKRVVRSVATPQGLIRFVTGNGAGALPANTVHRVTFSLADHSSNGTCALYYRPDVNTSAGDQKTLITGATPSATGTTYTATFTTPVAAPGVNSGFALVSGSGSANLSWAELGDLLIERAPFPTVPADIPTGFFNGDTTDTERSRYSYNGSGESVEEWTDKDIDPPKPPKPGLVVDLDYNNWNSGSPTGPYLKSMIPADVSYSSGHFPNPRFLVTPTPHPTVGTFPPGAGKSIVFITPAGAGGNSKASSGSTHGINFPKSMEAEIEYSVLFDDDSSIISPDPDEPGSGFDWAEGGKMPGLRGGLQNPDGSSAITIGGGDFSPLGFASRLMWQKPPSSNRNVSGIIVYLYWQNQTKQPDGPNYFGPGIGGRAGKGDNFGDGVGLGVLLQRGRWYRIRQRVVMNTPGVNNGKLQMWVDDVPRLDRNYLWRRSGDTWGIWGALMTMFHGGNRTEHVANRISKMWVDNTKIYRTP